MEGIKAPELRRCCFFIPLREGLLAFTYIRFVYHIFLLIIGLLLFGTLLMFDRKFRFDHLLAVPPLSLLFASVIYNVVVIAVVHSNNVTGIKKAIIFGTVLWVITIPISICLIYVKIKDGDYDDTSLAVVGLEPLLQGYGLLLIHSLKLKLRAEGTFEYIDMDKNVEA